MTATLCTLAYLGPGGLLGSIGAFLALLGALLLALLGFFWYPLKRLFGSKKQAKVAASEPAEDRSA
jgi:hypothetical protein